MPGIAVVAGGNIDQRKRMVASMADWLQPHPWLRRETYHVGEVAIALVRHEVTTSGTFKTPGGTLLVFDGFLADPSEARSLLDNYSSRGAATLCCRNGQYRLSLYDPVDRSLHLAVDRFGAWPIHHCEEDGVLIASSSAIAVARQMKRKCIDHEAIATFLRFGNFFGRNTYIQGLYCVDAGSVLSWKEGKVTAASEPIKGFSSTFSGSFESAVDGIRSRMRLAVKRVLQSYPKTGVFLSGGVDSRALALHARAHGSKPVATYTYGARRSADMKLAAAVGRVTGKHRAFDVPEDFVTSLGPAAVAANDGTSILHAPTWIMAVANARRECDAVLAGTAADLFFGSYVRGEHSEMTRERLVEHLISKLATGLDIHVFDTLVNERHRSLFLDAANDNFRNHFASIPFVTNVHDYYDNAVIWGRVRRWLYPSGETVRSGVELVSPFHDTDLLDFVFTLPPEYRHKQVAYRRAVALDFPTLASIPIAKTNMPLRYGKCMHFVGRVVTRLGEEVGSFLGGELPWPRHRQFLDEPGLFRVPGVRWYNDLLLSERTLDRGLFNRAGVLRAIKEHLSGLHNHAYLLGFATTVELTLRMMLDGEKPEASWEQVRQIRKYIDR
jgi:asparagine synthase (glutamine-hydrolysing)